MGKKTEQGNDCVLLNALEVISWTGASGVTVSEPLDC